MSGKLGDIAALTDPDCGAAQSGGELAALLEALNSLPALAREGRETSAGVLLESMRYSLGLRGKRARGLLVLLVAQGWSEPWQNALDCAHAVEMVHTASLIVDDLPSMDNAATRRGQPTNHVQFGQPVAILSSIALLSEALRLLSTSDQLAQDQRNLAVSCLASAIGPDGMAAGQIRDLTPPGDTQTDVEVTHAHKTGTLFAAAAELGCIAAGVDGPRKWLLSDFGMLLGKAFQEFDDLIDVATASRKAGKDTGKDVGKPTIVGLLGREKAEEHALRQVGLALECLEAAGIEARELRQYTLDLTRAMRAMIGPAQSIKGGMA